MVLEEVEKGMVIWVMAQWGGNECKGGVILGVKGNRVGKKVLEDGVVEG